MTALAETWLLLFLLAAGLGTGAALVLAVERLLDDAWTDRLRPTLAALARFGPLAALLLLPALTWFAPLLYPPETHGVSRIARAGAALAIATVLGWVVARRDAGRWSGGITLMLLVLVGALAMEDWALSRDPSWTGSVQGVALLTGQAAAALSLATLRAAWHGTPGDRAARTGLERMLLALALAALWFWFTQYLVVYAADIPAEAAWYLRRQAWPWGALKTLVGLPALLGAIALGLVPQWTGWRFVAVATLLIVHHAVHVLWVLRPEAGAGVTLAWTDAAALLMLAPVLAARQLAR